MSSAFNKLHLIRQIDLFSLKLFLTVVEERQIGRAAARENIAASAATKRIQDLEEIAGVKLFERNPKGVVPSLAGEVLARHLHLIFGSLEDIRREVSEFTEGVRGHIRISSTGAIIIQFLAREIADFTRNFPLVDIDLREDTNPNVVRAVSTGDVDLAVFVATPDLLLDDVESVEYRNDWLVAVVPRGHALGERPELSLADLLDENLIAISPSTSLMAQVRLTAKECGKVFKPKYTVNSVEVASSLVQAGLGVTIQPECMLSLEDHDRVAMVPLTDPWARRSLHLATQRTRVLTPATRAFLKQLTDRPRPVEGLAFDDGGEVDADAGTGEPAN